MQARGHVFFDPSGRRGRVLRRGVWLVAVATVLAAIAFVASLVIHHPLTPSSDVAALFEVSTQRVLSPRLKTSADELAATARALSRARSRQASAGRVEHASGHTHLLDRPDGRPLSVAFYVNWDDNSRAALERRIGNIDVLMPVWLNLSNDDESLRADIDQSALEFITTERPHLPIVPVIQNSAGDDSWDGIGLAKLLADPALRQVRTQQLVDFLIAHNFAGLTLDFEEVPPAAQPDLQAFVGELHAAFAPHQLTLAIAVPFSDDNWNYRRYGSLADFVILMAYDEHWAQGTPGSIASQDWFESILDRRMQQLDPDRTIVGIGAYGYDWVPGRTATDLTFHDAIQAASDSEADIDFDAASNNPHFDYTEDDGTQHNVWFLDGVTGFNQIHAADVYRPAGYALWRLGSEDPSLWSAMGRPYGSPAPEALKTIAPSADINIDGAGEILKVGARPAPGKRDIEVEKDTGDISDETYTTLPSSFVIHRMGNAPKQIALTFDDGPDPQWTPRILDVLEQKHAPATFFVIGENGAAQPALLRRLVDDGFEVGNHSYTHPNFALLPPEVARLELNATQRLFEATTGRSLRLFRPPFLGDSEPSTDTEVRPVDVAQSMGYLTVGLRIDPDDWERPPADEIVSRVIAAATSPDPDVRGNIVLLHDSGGDRAQTLAALPILIDRLRALGFELVPVSKLAGLTRDQAMPLIPAHSAAAWVDGYVFGAVNIVGAVLGLLFEGAIGLGVARAVLLCTLALWNRESETRRIPPPAGSFPVSVLIPAYNEAVVIVSSIKRVLSSTASDLEVIVIDDGSTDGTSDAVRAAFDADPRVRLLTVPNGGKAGALNVGLAHSSGDVVVALDADTQFETQTIARLIRWFADPIVGAVAGNAKVGNRVNLATRWQALEYVTAQNLERRALAALGAITVVPGAIGAWRRSVLTAMGGFPGDTLAEDQDLTIALQRTGMRIVFDPEAIAWTEAPQSFRTLARQRFRWAYGTLQCLWKHKRAFFNPRHGMLGWFALPQVALFQVGLALLSPLVDLLFVWQLIHSSIDYLQHGEHFVADNLLFALECFVLFTLIDLGGAAIGFLIEGQENWRLLLWLPLQRFGYRQLMYYVVVKSVVKALTGPQIGWGKLDRTGAVAIEQAPSLP